MADDLFGQLDSLFSKVPIENPASPFILHRFLASDPDFAQAAAEIQKFVREPAMVQAVWQAALPRQSRSPKLQYTGPRKGKGANELVQRLMSTHAYSRAEAEEMVALVTEQGRLPEACREYGVELAALEKGA